MFRSCKLYLERKSFRLIVTFSNEKNVQQISVLIYFFYLFFLFGKVLKPFILIANFVQIKGLFVILITIKILYFLIILPMHSFLITYSPSFYQNTPFPCPLKKSLLLYIVYKILILLQLFVYIHIYFF